MDGCIDLGMFVNLSCKMSLTDLAGTQVVYNHDINKIYGLFWVFVGSITKLRVGEDAGISKATLRAYNNAHTNIAISRYYLHRSI